MTKTTVAPFYLEHGVVTAIARSCFAHSDRFELYSRALPRHALLALIRALLVSKIDCNYRQHV